MKRNELIIRLAGAGLYNGRWELDDELYSTISVPFIRDAHAEWVRDLPPELQARNHLLR